MPEAIVKALEQNAKDEAAGVFDDGKKRYDCIRKEKEVVQCENYTITCDCDKITII